MKEVSTNDVVSIVSMFINDLEGGNLQKLSTRTWRLQNPIFFLEFDFIEYQHFFSSV